MSDIITLSSDEEEIQPPHKRLKPIPVPVISNGIQSRPSKRSDSDIVILSDDETEQRTAFTHSKNGYNQPKFTKVIKDPNNSIIISDDQDKTLVNLKHSEVKNIAPPNHTEHLEEKSITVDETSSIDSSGKENNLDDNLPKQNNILSDPSSSKLNSAHDELLESLLKVCEDNIVNSQYETLIHNKFAILRKYYKKCGPKLSESQNFLQLLDDNMLRAKKSPATAVISFNEIFQYIKEVVDTGSIEVSEKHRIKLKKLEKTIKLLLMRIKHLENSEIDFEDEEDSAYLQLDRYTMRLNKVYKKYCELLKKNPYSGRITYEKLDFVDSEYNEINRAISKRYKNNEKFPSYYEMEEYIRKVVAEYKLDLSEAKLKIESTRCFKKLGELLQNRRKKELYDAHYSYVRDTEDPANVDQSLDSTLQQSFVAGQIKIEKICEEFRVKEELGEEAVLSEADSEDSGDEESEHECEKST